MQPKIRLLLGLLFVGLSLLVACRDANDAPSPDVATAAPTATPTPLPTPTPTPREQLTTIAETMQALDSVRFALTRTGAPVALTLSDTVTVDFNAAFGQYAAPDRVQARATVAGFGVIIEIQTIAIGDQQWITDPLSQAWQPVPDALAFNPAILFDPEQGWLRILDENVTTVEAPGRQEINGQTYAVLQVALSGDRVRTVTGGLAGDDEVAVTLYYDDATHRIAQMRFDTGGGDAVSNWTLIFDQYNQAVTIEAPVEGESADFESDK